ncbi:acyl-CoA synthetase [Saccharibacillus sp. O16]|nr:acyl-CoA synthetase [Saccharibacillus sp. O16]
MHILEGFLKHTEQMPEKVAITVGEQSYGYRFLRARMEAVAEGLRQSDCVPGNIAIVAGNRIEFIEMLLGAIYAGCVPVLMDVKWNNKTLVEALTRCRPRIIAGESPSIQPLGGPKMSGFGLTFSDSRQTVSYSSWISSLEKMKGSISFNKKLFIGYTSGTTGSPKAYTRTHSSWLRSFEASARAFCLADYEQVSAPGPLVHSLTLFTLMQSLHNGTTFHMFERFDAAELLKVCTTFPGMALHVVPAMIDSLTTLAEFTQTQVPIGALISSGSSWSEQSKQRCRDLFPNTALYEYYGSSEASYISYRDAREPDRIGALGRPFQGVEISIRDEHFHEVPPGEIGQLYVRSDMIFTGYGASQKELLNKEQSALLQDGWLRTGDEVYGDAENGLYLAGRSGNLIKSGGLKVFPEEVEAVLQRMPEIEQAVVFGELDERWGERVVAMVRWRSEGQRRTLGEIRQFCLAYLESYKIPKQLIETDSFPYTPSGKIARQQLKKQVGGRAE